MLKERDEQFDIKNAKAEYEKYIDNRYHDKLMTDLEKANQNNELKEFNGRMKRKENFNSIKGQKTDESKNKKLGEKINSNFDKEILKNAMTQMKLEKIKEDTKRDETTNLMQETIVMNKENQKLLKKKAQAEIEYDKKIAQFAKEKEAKQLMFKEKIEKKKNEANAIRQKMIDKQAEFLMSLQKNEEVRLDGQVATERTRSKREIFGRSS